MTLYSRLGIMQVSLPDMSGIRRYSGTKSTSDGFDSAKALSVGVNLRI